MDRMVRLEPAPLHLELTPGDPRGAREHEREEGDHGDLQPADARRVVTGVQRERAE
jgi:hypothetical protein